MGPVVPPIVLLYRVFRANVSSPRTQPLAPELTSDIEARIRFDRWKGTSWNVSTSCCRASAALICGGLSDVLVTCGDMGFLLPLRNGRNFLKRQKGINDQIGWNWPNKLWLPYLFDAIHTEAAPPLWFRLWRGGGGRRRCQVQLLWNNL